MATFDYVDIPVDAIRLQSTQQDSLAHRIKPARKILSSLPETGSITAQSASRRPQFDSVSSNAGGMSTSTSASASAFMQSPTKTALSLVPQLLLSAALPGSVPSVNSSTSASTPVPNTMPNMTPNPKAPPHTLLSTRDPLSLPIMTSNFRRFVARVGPVFWLQDRIEEVILWKKGWKRTVMWLAAYAFFCYFPRMILLIPHMFLLGVMLAYYPHPGVQPVPINVGEGGVDWQANIQAIQNLMGAFSDVHDAILPLLPLLVPPASSTSPASAASTSSSTTASMRRPSFTTSTLPKSSHIRDVTSVSSPTSSVSSSSIFTSTSMSSSTPTLRPFVSSPDSSFFTPHHLPLILTLLSFIMLLPILMADILPLRLLFFLAGAGTVGCGHPSVRAWINEMWRWKNAEGLYGMMSSLFASWTGAASAARMRLRAQSMFKYKLDKVDSSAPTTTPGLGKWQRLFPFPFSLYIHVALTSLYLHLPSIHLSHVIPSRLRVIIRSLSPHRLQNTLAHTLTPAKIKTTVRRIIDNDRLTDEAWAAAMCTVELWENERWVEDTKGSSSSSIGGRRTSFIGTRKTDDHTRERDRDGIEPEDESYVLTPLSSSSVLAVSAHQHPPESSLSSSSASFVKMEQLTQTQPHGTWSKLNLRPFERAGWTRGRDGWCGIGGEVSSNLTFSLSPGWAFIETEGWRPDLEGRWVYENINDGVVAEGTGTGENEDTTWRCGADRDGWTYSTDTWAHPRSDARPGDGWVTRRRRWVRRVCWTGEVGA